MPSKSSFCLFHSLTVVLVLLVALGPSARAQHGSQGTVTVTVLDQAGGVVPGAELELQDLATNDARKAQTQSAGTYSFVNLSIGTYRLKISSAGFKTQVFDTVVVQATKTTDITATLTVGALSETVEVSASATPVVEESSNSIGTTVDLKQIESLPIQGRDLTQLSRLVPGYTGTWDGLPSVAQGSNIDGVIGSSSRMKFSGNAAPSVSPRLEDIEEMTVQTDQLDLNQGFGQANMQTNFVTRRGSNAFHGRVFEDHRNAALNANSWHNDALTALHPNSPVPKNHFILNDFGGSLGGPILKDKLFFFGSFSMSKQPGSNSATEFVLSPAAQAGNFTFKDANSNNQTVNVLQLAANGGFNSAFSQKTSNTLTAANKALSHGVLENLGDPNLQQLNWQVPSPTTIYYPTVRVDYKASEKMRFNVAFNETKTSQPGANIPDLPGPDFSKTGAGNQFKNYTTAVGFDWMLTPALINSFRGGFLYTYNGFAFDAPALNVNNPQISWNLLNVNQPYNTGMNATNYKIPTGSYYPLFNASDTMTWQHKAHTLNYGFSWWREQDHYYNGVQGFPVIDLGSNTPGATGLAAGDPALGAFEGGQLPNSTPDQRQEAESLYAILTGRINDINGQYAYNPTTGTYAHALGAYNLDELQKAWGLFFQDSYRIKPNLTLNYGLRWDFTGADRDLTNFYHSSSAADIFGPSGVWNLFNPGSLKGTMDPKIFQNSQPYNNWNVSPQPAFGLAWNPHKDKGWLGSIFGGDQTVVRAGLSMRKFTEPQQYIWNQASDYGSFYYQSFYAKANGISLPGNFAPGSLSLDNPTPLLGYGYAPQQYLKSESASDFYLGGPGINGIDPHLKQPYTISWNFGIQRRLGENRALEVRYVGNRTLHQWNTVNPNEVNIFENGFLQEFKNAQNNLKVCTADPGCAAHSSFANQGLAGQVALPIFTAAFAGEDTVPGGLYDFTSKGAFVSLLDSGQAGAAAGLLAGTNGAANINPGGYFCNLVGASFAPCAAAGHAGAGAGYPINFFTANPFANGTNGIGYLVAQAASNYNALQIDFRQRTWGGLQFDANYTWSKTLGTGTQNNWQGQTATFTLRDPRLAYGPSLFDIRHTVNVNGTYDLPLGHGKRFLNDSRALDIVVGGWTIGAIATFRGGLPFLLQGGNSTFNDYGDGGVVLNGVTASQLQSAIGVYRRPGTANVAFIDPKYLNGQYITANTTPGTIGQRIWLYGPHTFNQDMSISKSIPFTESVRFTFQAMFLNSFNHPVFSPGQANGCAYGCYLSPFTPNVQSGSFLLGSTYGSGSVTGTSIYKPRQIELRANIEF